MACCGLYLQLKWNSMQMSHWLNTLQSQGRYTFTRREVEWELVRYQEQASHLENVVIVLRELAELLDAHLLLDLVCMFSEIHFQ